MELVHRLYTALLFANVFSYRHSAPTCQESRHIQIETAQAPRVSCGQSALAGVWGASLSKIGILQRNSNYLRIRARLALVLHHNCLSIFKFDALSLFIFTALLLILLLSLTFKIIWIKMKQNENFCFDFLLVYTRFNTLLSNYFLKKIRTSMKNRRY